MTDPGNINLIVLVLVSACAFASVLGIAWPMLAPDPLASRLKVNPRMTAVWSHRSMRL